MNSSADDAASKWPSGWHAKSGLPACVIVAATLVLTCAASIEASAKVPLPQPRPAEAPSADRPQPEQGGAADQAAEPPESKPPELSACRLALTDSIAIAPSIPSIKGPGGCGGEDLVRLEAVVLSPTQRVALKPAAILRCAMATAVAEWVRTDMVPLATGLGTTISELDNFDSFECRGRNRVKGAKLSEHGLANAIDVRGMKFANGNTLSLTDRTSSREIREKVLASVCTRFTTVLGPGSDWYHEDHIHLDLAQRRNNYKLCQWGVYDPLPGVAPLMPAERPEEAPPRQTAEERLRRRNPARKHHRRPQRKKVTNQRRPPSRAAGCLGKPAPNKKAPDRPALWIKFDRGERSDDQVPPPPPCSAIFELKGESPCLGSSTTTTLPCFARL